MRYRTIKRPWGARPKRRGRKLTQQLSPLVNQKRHNMREYLLYHHIRIQLAQGELF